MRLSTILDVKVSNEHIRVLLEFSQGTNLIFDKCISISLKFKRLSPNAKAPVHATEGSVGYDLFLAVWQYSNQYHRKNVVS